MRKAITTTVLVTVMAFSVTGCSTLKSLFTPVHEIAVDKVYVPRPCPEFSHEFEIKGRKYSTNDVDGTTLVMTLPSLTESLVRNTKARETFNEQIVESNKEIVVKDETYDNPDERVEKRIFVDRECPKYYYSPEFKARKLLPTFQPDQEITYVVVPLDDMVFQMEKHKLTKETYNTQIDELNADKSIFTTIVDWFK